MITFDPDGPWEVGQVVMFRNGDDFPWYPKIVTAVEHSEDGTESQYEFRNMDWQEYAYGLQGGTVSVFWNWHEARRDFDCPKCGVPKGDRCRTLTSGKPTETHGPRLDLAWNRHVERRRRGDR